MLVDIIRQIPQIEQVIPYLTYFALPIFGITLHQAAKAKARYLGNNLPKQELLDLKVDVQDALAEERRALEGKITYTSEIAQKASLARMVQTKIESASEKREEGKKGKQKVRKYMQGL